MIPLSTPYISGNEWKYIKECLDTGWVSSVGSYVSRFEDIVAGYIGKKYAVATVNGTAALHTSLMACGVTSHDEVIVPTLTFVAPANTITYCGAKPVFMDCDPKTLCLDTQKVIDFLKKNTVKKRDGFAYNRISKKRIKAIIPVHIFGHPVDMDSLSDICKEMNISIIEDATESLGSEYKSRKAGALGDIGCISFNGNKIITTGGGGMVVTDDEQIAKKVRHLTTQAKIGTIEYDHDQVGYNYRLTNIQAAMGVAQMEKLDAYLLLKRKNACLYRELLAGIDDVAFMWEEPWARSNFWFYTIQILPENKAPLMDYLLASKIQARPIWKLIHTLPMYKDCQGYAIEKAVQAYNRSINLPCSAHIAQDDIKYVAKKIIEYFKK